MTLLLPTPLDVTAAFVQKCVVRLTDSLPLTSYNETKLKHLLKSPEAQQFFAFYFRFNSRKLVSSAAKSGTVEFQQLSSLISYTLDEARVQSSFSVAYVHFHFFVSNSIFSLFAYNSFRASLLEATVDADTGRENGPDYAMYCLNVCDN